MNRTNQSPDLLKVELLLASAANAASMLGMSRSFFYQLHSSGRLGPMPVPFGRKKLWRVEELRAWTQHEPPCPSREAWLKIRKEDNGR